MNKQKLLHLSFVTFLVVLFTVPYLVLAQGIPPSSGGTTGGINDGINQVGSGAGLNRGVASGINAGTGSRSVITVIINVIKIILAIAGAIAILFVIIGGIQYMTSFGNEAGAKKGRATLTNALIGLVIIILSYAIVTVIVNLIT